MMMNKVKLKDVCSIIGDGIHGTPKYVEKSDYYFINGNNLKSGFIVFDEKTKMVSKEEAEKYSLPLNKNTLLMSINGTLGSLAKYRDEKIMLGKSAAYINCKKINLDYLFYYFQQEEVVKNFYNVATGSTIKNLSLNSLQNFEIPSPSFSIQTNIAHVLSSFDDKIELNNKINRELENMAKMIYEYWFVQDANKKWERRKIVELIKNQKNGDWGKETKQENYTEKVICIRGADINSLTGNNELKAPERYILEKNNDKYLTDGDFVIEISGGSPTQSTGRIAYILEEMLKGFETPLICSNFCKAISLKDRKYFYYFIFIWKQLYDNGLFFGYEGKTSGIKNFLFDDFVSFYKIAVPSTSILNKFNKIVSPIFSTIIKNRQENACLAQLRDFLLPLLMNGQVKVKNG
jgi:type I restriction enzyme S subunit